MDRDRQPSRSASIARRECSEPRGIDEPEGRERIIRVEALAESAGAAGVFEGRRVGLTVGDVKRDREVEQEKAAADGPEPRGRFPVLQEGQRADEPAGHREPGRKRDREGLFGHAGCHVRISPLPRPEESPT